jgi:hypothetical protein
LWGLDAALKRRSSTVLQAAVFQGLQAAALHIGALRDRGRAALPGAA